MIERKSHSGIVEINGWWGSRGCKDKETLALGKLSWKIVPGA